MMFRICFMLSAFILSLASTCFSQTEDKKNVNTTNSSQQNPIVLLKTSMGNIKIELYPDKAPVTVENFLNYVSSGQYDDTIFHRVIPGFMVQGGGFTVDFKQKPTNSPIQNEADNGLKNTRGTLAMARTSDPNSASAQFFINLANNPFLDFKARTPSGWGYAVFGKVIEGMDVVDRIAKVKTGAYEGHHDVPLDPVIIIEAKDITPKSADSQKTTSQNDLKKQNPRG